MFDDFAMAFYQASDRVELGDFRVRWDFLRDLERQEDNRALSRHLMIKFGISDNEDDD